jgi:peroxiredoxin
MKSRVLVLALACTLGLCSAAIAQAPKAAEKGGDKKAPAPKTPADLAFDEFNKVKNEQGGKFDQSRFQRLIAAGLGYLSQYPTHGRVSEVIRELAFFAKSIDAKQAALRTSYASNLKLEVTNYRYKEGLSDPAKAAIAALDAAIADYDVREVFNADNVNTLREKIDALAQTPGGERFLVDRERSYSHVLMVGSGLPRAEAHLKKLLEHPQKPVQAMAREELVLVEARKQPLDLKFTGLDGKEVDLAQLRGKVVVIVFWSSTNKGSTDRFEGFRQLSSNYRKKGMEIVTVSHDKEEDREKLAKFIKENRIAWPVLFDGKAAKGEFSAKVNATGVPRIYIVDQKGILQTTLTDERVSRVTADFSTRQVEGKIKQLLNIK